MTTVGQLQQKIADILENLKKGNSSTSIVEFSQLLASLDNDSKLCSTMVQLKDRTVPVYVWLMTTAQQHPWSNLEKLVAIFIINIFSKASVNDYLKLELLNSDDMQSLAHVLVMGLGVKAYQQAIIKYIETLPPALSQKFLKELCEAVRFSFDDTIQYSSDEEAIIAKHQMIEFINYVRRWGLLDSDQQPLESFIAQAKDRNGDISISPQIRAYKVNMFTEKCLRSLGSNVDLLWEQELNEHAPFKRAYLNDMQDRLMKMHVDNHPFCKTAQTAIAHYFITQISSTQIFTEQQWDMIIEMIFFLGLELSEPNALQIIIKDALDNASALNFSGAETWEDYFTLAFDAFKLLRDKTEIIMQLKELLTLTIQSKFPPNKTAAQITSIIHDSNTAAEVYKQMQLPNAMLFTRNIGEAVLGIHIDAYHKKSPQNTVNATPKRFSNIS